MNITRRNWFRWAGASSLLPLAALAERATSQDHNDHAMVLWDRFPVSGGHLLVCTRRHVADWFEATSAEQQGILELLHRGRSLILEQFDPAGFNIGVNVGAAAGHELIKEGDAANADSLITVEE